jgi:hypothetical protein
MAEDEEESVYDESVDLEDREDQSIDWAEAVERGRYLHNISEHYQMKLGHLASKVATEYGEETLQNFADEIEVPFETLKRCRSVWRAWEKEGRHPFKYSVARALARIPEKDQIWMSLIEERGGEGLVTEKAALQAAKDYRERRSAGKYKDFPLHKAVSRACRILNAILDEDSELQKLLDDIQSYETRDHEYTHKIDDALEGAIERLTEARKALIK